MTFIPKALGVPSLAHLFIAAFFLFSLQSRAQTYKPLTLEKAMALAELHSRNAQKAQESFFAAEAEKSAQFQAMFPNMSASGQYLEYSTLVNKAVGTAAGSQAGLPASSVFSAGLTVSQPIVGLWPLYLGVQRTAALARAAMANSKNSRAEARFYGAQVYLNAIKSCELLKIADLSVQVAKKQLDDALAQYNAGKLTGADVLKFKLNLENMKTSLLQAQTTQKVTLVTLAEAIDEPDAASIVLVGDYRSVFVEKADSLKPLDIFIKNAYGSRSDLNAAAQSVHAAAFTKQQAISDYLPSMNFILNYSRNFKAKDTSIPAAGVFYSKEDIQDNMYYGVNFTWNLIDWGVRQSKIAEALSNERVAKLSQDELRSNIKVQVISSYYQFQDAKQVLDSSRVSVQYAEDVYKQIRAQFVNGQATTTDVISASNDQAAARAKLANFEGDLDLAWLLLQKQSGSDL